MESFEFKCSGTPKAPVKVESNTTFSRGSPPMTPPASDYGTLQQTDNLSVLTALHVMSTERMALSNLETLYQTNRHAQQLLAQAVSQIAETSKAGGKLVVCGVGKSGRIGHKVVATMNSLGITSVFLHPTEALHGDLGIIKEWDTILMITFSGKTAELLNLLPHLPNISLVVMTSHLDARTCPLILNRPNSILLPAPIHESETVSFGLAAPTSSTSVAMALSDGLAMAVAHSVHNVLGQGPAEVFRKFHPGGAIGITNKY